VVAVAAAAAAMVVVGMALMACSWIPAVTLPLVQSKLQQLVQQQAPSRLLPLVMVARLAKLAMRYEGRGGSARGTGSVCCLWVW
jgi:hypothetical protein